MHLIMPNFRRNLRICFMALQTSQNGFTLTVKEEEETEKQRKKNADERKKEALENCVKSKTPKKDTRRNGAHLT